MSSDRQKSNFWTTLPGILTGIAAVITALGGFIVLFQSNESPTSGSTSSPAKTETLTVYANSGKGESYTNEENKAVNVSFTATGTWLAVPETINNDNIPESAKGYISPKGDPNFRSNNNTPCPGNPLGALVIKNSKGQCLADGETGSFKVKPEETAYFVMNDVETLYKDNDGSINVELSVE